jgi:uncharacterized protein (DUF305 family)
MKLRTTALAASALTLALILAGCSPSADDSGTDGMPGMEHSSSTPSADVEAVNASDEMFVQMMIPHHEQAIEMADTILGKTGVDERVIALAEEIKGAQGPEIEQMNAWLAAWGAEGAADGMGHDMGDGMMSEDDMVALGAADGNEAARLFLEQMIVHHEGAIEMAQTEVDAGSHPDVIALAQAVIDGQTAEITTMQDLLESI